jgi:uncharacterized membrane protein YwaF
MPLPHRLVLFSAEHVATLLVLAVITVVLTMVVRRAARQPGGAGLCRGVCWGIAGVTIAGALFKQVYEVAGGTWTARESLPLHVCDVAILLMAVAIVGAARTACGPAADRTAAPRPSIQRLYELAYYWGLCGTLQALLTPDIEQAFPHPVFFRYFVTHGGIVVGVIVMTAGLHLRPRPRSWRWVWVVTLAWAAIVLGINGLLGANYMFLCGPPAHPSLIDTLGPWPWSLLGLAALGTALLLLCYSPWWLIELARRRRTAAAHARG